MQEIMKSHVSSTKLRVRVSDKLNNEKEVSIDKNTQSIALVTGSPDCSDETTG